MRHDGMSGLDRQTMIHTWSALCRIAGTPLGLSEELRQVVKGLSQE